MMYMYILAFLLLRFAETSGKDQGEFVSESRRRLRECPTPLLDDSSELVTFDGWNVWDASCTFANDITVSFGETMKIKRDPAMVGTLVIDRQAEKACDNKYPCECRHFEVVGVLELTSVSLTGGLYSTVYNKGFGAAGSVMVSGGGSVIFTSCALFGNKADQGGAVFVRDSPSTATFIDSTLRSNEAQGYGGGGAVKVFNGGSVIFTGSTLTSNRASHHIDPYPFTNIGKGGAVFVSGAMSSATFQQCLITGNSAATSTQGSLSAFYVEDTALSITIINSNPSSQTDPIRRSPSKLLSCDTGIKTACSSSIATTCVPAKSPQLGVACQFDSSQISIPNAICTDFRFPDTCTALNCTKYKFDKNKDPTDGCEIGFETPTVTSVSTLAQASAPGESGIPMTIKGTNFAVDQVPLDKVSVFVETECSTIVYCKDLVRVSDEQINCMYPEGGVGCTAYTVRVSVAEEASKEDVSLCYEDSRKKNEISPTKIIVFDSLMEKKNNNDTNMNISPFVTVSWSIQRKEIKNPLSSFHIQLSDSPDFISAKTWIHPTSYPLLSSSSADSSEQYQASAINISKSLDLVLPKENWIEPLWKKVIYVRVKFGSNGAWSSASQKWTTADQCNSAFYLNNTILSGNPTFWECTTCPKGGSCEGSVLTDSIKALFGWSRCVDRTKSNISLKFERCGFSGACLGGHNPILEARFQIAPNISKRQIEECHPGYLPNSTLCGACSPSYSHSDLSGRCSLCPEPATNGFIAFLGIVFGAVGLVIIVKITLSDNGRVESADGVKSIGLSFVQLIALMDTFPIQWPPIFVTLFQIGGAVTALGQHLINFKCMAGDEIRDADVFFSQYVLWSFMPFIIVIGCIGSWLCLDQRAKNQSRTSIGIENLGSNIRISCVALLYLVYPSVSSNTFSIFACRNICDSNNQFLRADLDEVCWYDRHLVFVILFGVPMLIGFVLGLPFVSFVVVGQIQRRVHELTQENKEEETLMNEEKRDEETGRSSTSTQSKSRSSSRNQSRSHWFDGNEVRSNEDTVVKSAKIAKLIDSHRTYGLLYSVYRDDVWWWEGTVAFRKIVIAGVAVFGSNLGMMQVHITSMLIATSLLFTAHVQPFGGENHELLQMLEMGSLMVTFLTLWCGGIFNSFPRCIDEDGNEMWWCNGMAVIVGLLVIVFIAVVIYYFFRFKKEQENITKAAGGTTAATESSVSTKIKALVSSVREKVRSRLNQTSISTNTVNPLDVGASFSTTDTATPSPRASVDEQTSSEMVDMTSN